MTSVDAGYGPGALPLDPVLMGFAVLAVERCVTRLAKARLAVAA